MKNGRVIAVSNFVVFGYGIVCIGILWCGITLGIVYYHAKFGTPSFKNGRVIAVLNLVVFAIVWYIMV